jgi:hypothetical protein
MPRLKTAPLGERIDIAVGRQADGGAYELDPLSRKLIERRFPGLEPPRQVFLAYPKREDFKRVHGPLWRHVALMLTGLTDEQLEELGGFRIYDPLHSRFVHDNLSTSPRRRPRRTP